MDYNDWVNSISETLDRRDWQPEMVVKELEAMLNNDLNLQDRRITRVFPGAFELELEATQILAVSIRSDFGYTDSPYRS